MNPKLYKVLAPCRRSCHGGSHTWEPGVWYTVEGELVACKRGFHLCRANDLLEWLHAEIWHAEARGQIVDGGNKLVVRSARITTPTAWGDTTARLFAADCAERALAVAKVTDARSHAAVKAAREFAGGLIDAAAGAAAWAAARDAARDAAGDAARDAAKAAAWAAARDAAWDAAGDAARAAARAAAGAAAGDVAGDAARAAARAAAWVAERAWQTKRLVAYIEGRVDIERVIAEAYAGGSAARPRP